MMITTEDIQAYAAIATILLTAGKDVAAGIKALLAALHGPTMTDAELNAICQQVVQDATRRKAMADADAAGL